MVALGIAYERFAGLDNADVRVELPVLQSPRKQIENAVSDQFIVRDAADPAGSFVRVDDSKVHDAPGLVADGGVDDDAVHHPVQTRRQR